MSHNWHSSPTMSSVLVCQSIPKFGYLAWHRHSFLHSEAGLQHDPSLTPLLRVHYTQLHSVFKLLLRVRAIFVYYISKNGGGGHTWVNTASKVPDWRSKPRPPITDSLLCLILVLCWKSNGRVRSVISNMQNCWGSYPMVSHSQRSLCEIKTE